MVKSFVTFRELLNKCDDQLFKSIQRTSNCLNHIVPVSRSSMHNTRRLGQYDLHTLLLVNVNRLTSMFVSIQIAFS